MGRVSPVDVFEDTQDIAVSCSVVSTQPQEYVINHIDYVRERFRTLCSGSYSFTRLMWLIYLPDIPHSCIWHDSLIRVTRLISVCDVICLILMCGMCHALFKRRHAAFTSVTCLVPQMWCMLHACTWCCACVCVLMCVCLCLCFVCVCACVFVCACAFACE